MFFVVRASGAAARLLARQRAFLARILELRGVLQEEVTRDGVHGRAREAAPSRTRAAREKGVYAAIRREAMRYFFGGGVLFFLLPGIRILVLLFAVSFEGKWRGMMYMDARAKQ